MIVVTSPDFAAFSDAELIRAVTSGGRRPNVMVDCANRSAIAIVERLHDLCGPPVHSRQIPGPLNLPAGGFGTLLLHDVAALTLGQQVELSDWLHRRRAAMQVVSIAHTPVAPMVRDGRFLEGLFYRLNTISISATGRH